jgi:excisionase family DNA binding protein
MCVKGRKVTNVLTAEEVAARVRVHAATIRRMARNGEIRAVRVGGQWRFAVDVVDQLEAQMAGEAA